MRGLGPPLTKLVVFTLVTILSVILLLFGIQNAYFAGTNSYQARFSEVSGLISGSVVKIAGVRVGTVEKVEIVDRNQAEVTFSVDEGKSVPQSAILAIKYQNLIGQRFLDISRGNGPVGASLAPGGEIPLAQTRPPLDLTTVFNGFKPLFQALSPNDINQLAFEIIQVLQGESSNIGTLLSRTASLTATIADRDAVIGSVINNLNLVLDTVNVRDERLSGLIISLQQLTSGLAQDRVAIGESLQPIADLTQTTAGLINDIRPPLRDDIVKLGIQSQILNNNRDDVENFLRLTQQKSNNFGRAGSYGSWFNFYLCRLGLNITGLPQGQNLIPQLPLPGDAAGRCSSAGTANPQ